MSICADSSRRAGTYSSRSAFRRVNGAASFRRNVRGSTGRPEEMRGDAEPEEVEHEPGGDRIPRQGEDEAPAVGGEGDRLSGLDRHAGEERGQAQRAQGRGDEVGVPFADAAGDHDEIGDRERRARSMARVASGSSGMRRGEGHVHAVGRGQGGEHRAVAVHDLAGTERRRVVGDLVSGGEDGDPHGP